MDHGRRVAIDDASPGLKVAIDDAAPGLKIAIDSVPTTVLMGMPQPHPTTGLYDLADWINDLAAPLWVQDHAGAWWEIPQGQVALEGARIVDNSGTLEFYNRLAGGELITPAPRMVHARTNRNKLNTTNLLDTAGTSWPDGGSITRVGGQTDPNGKTDAVKFTNVSGGFIREANVAAAGDVKSIWARTVSGTGKVGLLSHSSQSVAVDVTDQWQRFEITYNVDPSEYPANFHVVDFRTTGTTLTEVVVWHPQLEVGDVATRPISVSNGGYTRLASNLRHSNASQYFDSAQGAAYLRFSMAEAQSALSGDFGLVAQRSAKVNMLYLTATQLRSTDDSTVLSHNTSFPADSEIEVGLIWSADGYKLGYKDGGTWNWTALTAYTGWNAGIYTRLSYQSEVETLFHEYQVINTPNQIWVEGH